MTRALFLKLLFNFTIKILFLSLLFRFLVGSYWIYGVLGFIAVYNFYIWYKDLIKREDMFKKYCNPYIYSYIHDPEMMEVLVKPTYTEKYRSYAYTTLAPRFFAIPHHCQPYLIYSEDGHYKATVHHTAENHIFYNIETFSYYYELNASN